METILTSYNFILLRNGAQRGMDASQLDEEDVNASCNIKLAIYDF